MTYGHVSKKSPSFNMSRIVQNSYLKMKYMNLPAFLKSCLILKVEKVKFFKKKKTRKNNNNLSYFKHLGKKMTYYFSKNTLLAIGY